MIPDLTGPNVERRKRFRDKTLWEAFQLTYIYDRTRHDDPQSPLFSRRWAAWLVLAVILAAVAVGVARGEDGVDVPIDESWFASAPARVDVHVTVNGREVKVERGGASDTYAGNVVLAPEHRHSWKDSAFHADHLGKLPDGNWFEDYRPLQECACGVLRFKPSKKDGAK